MSSAAADLVGGVVLLEFVAEASELMGFDKLGGCGLLAGEYCRVPGDLNVDGERFESVSGRAWVNEREEFTDIVSVGHDISRPDVECGIFQEQRAK